MATPKEKWYADQFEYHQQVIQWRKENPSYKALPDRKKDCALNTIRSIETGRCSWCETRDDRCQLCKAFDLMPDEILPTTPIEICIAQY